MSLHRFLQAQETLTNLGYEPTKIRYVSAALVRDRVERDENIHTGIICSNHVRTTDDGGLQLATVFYIGSAITSDPCIAAVKISADDVEACKNGTLKPPEGPVPYVRIDDFFRMFESQPIGKLHAPGPQRLLAWKQPPLLAASQLS